MINKLEHVLKERNVLAHKNSGVLICKVRDQKEGFDLAASVLSEIVDKKSVLYLSGGKTPRELYARLAREEIVIPGGVALVDERYGERLHVNSNEKMIRDTGFLRYLEMLDIPFYPILSSHPEFIAGSKNDEEKMLKQVQHDNERSLVAERYDEKYRFLLSTFPKHIGILGIGEDGHTAGIPSQISNLKSQISKIYTTNDLVVEYNDESGKYGERAHPLTPKRSYGERVTMTFMGLSMLDILLVLVFGSGKANALKLVFSEGSEEEVPGRFYKRPEIARKTLLVTDQEV